MAPFIFKIKFYTPGAGVKNAKHVNYIATRPGADKGDVEIGDDGYELSPDTSVGHIKYAGERPGSHGLFASEETVPNLDAIKEELKNHEGVVWRAVLSLKEDDAQRLGYTTREAWEKTLRVSMPEALNEMGLKESNVGWVAAFHSAQGHPHVHLVFWEKVPERDRGVLSLGERKDVRKRFVKEIYADERTLLNLEKTAMRDVIKDFAKEDTKKAVEIIKEIRQARSLIKVPGISPILQKNTEVELGNKLEGLAQLMPGKGRVALAYMPEEIKHQAREVADWILKQPSLFYPLEKHQDSVKGLTSQYTSQPEALEKAQNKAYNDMRDRVAQVVLKGAATLNFQGKDISFSPGQVVNTLWKSIWRNIEKERIKNEAQTEMSKSRQQKQVRQQARDREAGQNERER